MSNVLHFRPREKSDEARNLADFINLCVPNASLLTGQAFESSSWDVSGAFNPPGIKHKQHMHFCSWETAKSRNAKQAMSEPYASFAKAYTIYDHSRSQQKSFMARLTALRALHDVLASNGPPCVTSLATVHLDQTCQLLQERLSLESAYTVGMCLEKLNEFLIENRLSPRSSTWRMWLPRPENSRAKVGKEFDERRQEKIPSPAAFVALGSIFSIAVDTSDIVVTGACALLCGAPSRISEVLRLPVNCEAPQKTPSGLELLGLRWWPAKGAPPMVKPIVSVMRDAVQESLSRLRRVTENGRRLAKWYTENPGQMYLEDDLEHLRGKEYLNMREVDSIIYGVEPHVAKRPRQWCINAGVPIVRTEPTGRLSVRFEDVQAALLEMLPSGFPVADKDTGLLFKDSLFVLRKQELGGTQLPYRCMFDAVEQADIGGRLGIIAHRSIFTKHGYTEDDGSPILLTTHQFRHYLNTLAQGANLDQLDIARWSGRRNVTQNAAYDHTSGRDLLERVRDAITGEGTGVGPLARLHKVTLIRRDEFARLHIPTAHTTDFGHCIHDFTMLPCQVHQDCVNCNESVCIKGDSVRERNIRQALEEARLLVEKAEAAQKDSEAGADRWLTHHKLTYARLQDLCRILDDPSVPVGAVIQLSGVVPPSRLAQAAQQRLENGGADDSRKAA